MFFELGIWEKYHINGLAFSLPTFTHTNKANNKSWIGY